MLLLLRLSAQEQPVIYGFLPEVYQALPQNWSVSETKHGAVFGNSSGVIYYDGDHWKTFSIPGNHRVRSVYEQNDTIFCGGYGEFGYWVPTNVGEFVYKSLNKNLNFPLSEKEDIWHIEPYPGGVLYQSFSTIYLYEHDSISIISAPFPSGVMFSYYCQRAIYFQIIGGGLAKLDSDHAISMLPGCDALHGVTVTGIEEFGTALLISTDKQGFFLYENEILTPIFSKLKDRFTKSQINKILVEKDLIVVGTILEGVYVLDTSGSILFHFSTESGLPDNTVLALEFTDAGGLWVGLDYGLAYIDLSSPFFRYVDQEGSLGVVFCALEYDSRLYLGTNHGLFRSSQSGASTEFEIIEGTQGQVWSLRLAEDKVYCGHNKGTFEIVGRTATLVSEITGPWSWLASEQVNTFIQGTYTGVVVRQPNSQFKRLEGLNAPIRDLVRDKTGKVWGVNPYKGLYRFTLKGKSSETIHGLEQSLPEWKLPDINRLRMMKINNEIILRSDSGWFQLNFKELTFSPISSYKGLKFTPESLKLVDFGETLLLIEKNQVIIQNGNGVLAFETVGNLPEDPFAIKMTNEGFLVGTSQGYLVIYPDKLTKKQLPTPFVTKISVLAESEAIPYPLSAISPNSIELSSEEQGINIEFSSGFTPSKQRYRFSIGDKNGNTTAWSSKAEISIPLLPYGKTTIWIERKSDGQILQILCKREFPWYISQWGILLFILVGVLLMYLVLNQYQIYLKKKWRRQQVEEARLKHAKEIEEKNKQLEHDIEGQNQELAGITMNLVRKNEMLLELKENLKMFQTKPEKTSLRSIILKLNSQLSSEKDWEAFEYHFTRVHQSFFTDLKKAYPSLTSGDLRLAAYLRMNLSSKEIAPLLHISVRSLENKRYRLRKKLDLKPEQQIIDVLLRY